MGTWAIKTAERLVTVERNAEDSMLRSEEEKRILLHHCPRLWAQLRDWLKASCDHLNAKMGKQVLEFEIWPVSEARIRRIGRSARLQVEFGQEACGVWYSCGAGRGEYQFGVDADGVVHFMDAYDRQFTVEQVGEKLLDLLLASPF